jgi:hypothetical protein
LNTIQDRIGPARTARGACVTIRRPSPDELNCHRSAQIGRSVMDKVTDSFMRLVLAAGTSAQQPGKQLAFTIAGSVHRVRGRKSAVRSR